MAEERNGFAVIPAVADHGGGAGRGKAHAGHEGAAGQEVEVQHGAAGGEGHERPEGGHE